MFRYYALSDVCYVYLSDVPPGASSDYTAFRASRWHERGWTLQELIAPHNVLFMSQDWTPLGNKHMLADVLEEVTSIPASVLRLEEDFSTMSVAARMSWAARRKTTRVEDEAYSLFGLFGVSIPTIYGEGKNAFNLLQEEEILRSSVDKTLLVWGVDDEPWIHVEDSAQLEAMTNPEGSRPPEHALASSPSQFQRSPTV